MRKKCDRAKLAREIKEHLIDLDTALFIDIPMGAAIRLNQILNGQKLIFKKLKEIENIISS